MTEPRVPTASRRGLDVELRELRGIDELTACAALVAEVFGAENGEPVPADLVVAISLAGGYVGGAFRAGELVGVAIGFGEIRAVGGPPSSAMHSHVAAVAASARGLRVGWRLKMHQRAWALERGIDTIEWTFDPLVRRNAHLNLNLLGARAVRYLPNLYGAIPDALNAGQESDRVLVRWDLTSPTAIAASEGRPAVAVAGPGDATCETPADIEALVRDDPDAAKAWRARQRAVLQPALDGGAAITGITSDGLYFLRDTPREATP